MRVGVLEVENIINILFSILLEGETESLQTIYVAQKRPISLKHKKE